MVLGASADSISREIHIVDPDDKRRAQATRALKLRHHHSDFDPALEEFCRRDLDRGLILAADDDPGAAALSVLESVRSLGSAIPVIIYAEHPKTEQVASAMSAGALYYLEWPFTLGRIERVFQQLGSAIPDRFRANRLRLIASAKVSGLSSREREVFQHVVAGLSSRAIGELLNISTKTVEIHRGRIMRKLDARSVAHAVNIAHYAGMGARPF